MPSAQPMFRFLQVAGFLASVALVSAQPSYTLTDLGVLPGFASSVANGLNDLGQVVGYCAPAAENFNQTGFIWRNGVMTSTGKFQKGNYSIANAINVAGVAVGIADNGNSRPQSWVTNGNTLTNIFPNNGGNTHAIGINNAGAICGYYTKSLSGWTSSWHGAIWTVDPKDPRKFRTFDLPTIAGIDPTSTASFPFAFNQAGQAAGYAMNDVFGQHACFWNNDAAHSIVDLGVFGSDGSSLALGMNDVGQVVGSSHPPFGSRAVVWNNDATHTPSALPALPGDNYGSANGINTLGHVIGLSYYGTPGTWDATPARTVVWRDGGVYVLQAVIEPVSGAGWTVTSASAINNRGQIVGTGLVNGKVRAFLLTPR